MMKNAPGRTRLTRRTLLAGLAGAGVSACTSAPPPVPYHDTGRGAATPLPDRVPAAALINPETLWKIDTTFEPGTILIDPHGFLLYFVEARGLARRWPVALGRTGSAFTGEAVIGRKAEWPTWHPTPEMIARDPEKFGAFSDGVPGGPDNPLGARALYLYRNGQDTLFRIHGTNDPASIGKAVSSGCIRMHNTDVVMLYEKVSIGARVKALDAPLRAHPFQEVVSSPSQGSSHRDPARVSTGVRSSLYR